MGGANSSGDGGDAPNGLPHDPEEDMDGEEDED